MLPSANSIARTFALDTDALVFSLGCFERRVTIYSQQVRALLLANALVQEQLIRPRGRVAVVGGGIGGATLAAALTLAAPQATVVVFEVADRLMVLQRGGRDRYVHPHIFDWPATGSDSEDAGLPLMNWQAGPASDVAATLASQFEVLALPPRVEVRLKSRVSGLVPAGRSFKVAVNGVTGDEIFDAVVLCIGFGLEKHLDAQCPSYWSPSLLPAPLLTSKPVTEIFVSGNGDGGLADFALAAFNAETHGDILRFVTGHPQVAPLIERLLALDEQAWNDPAVDLHQAYLIDLLPLLPEALLLDVHDRLRIDVHVTLHTQDAQLFRRETAVLNRLVVFLALVADAHYASGRLQALVGRRLLPRHGEGPLQFEGGAVFSPDVRLLRFGPDRDAVRKPFERFMASAAAAAAASVQRPSTPALPDEVLAWYQDRMHPASEAPSAAPESHPPATPPGAQRSPDGVQVNVIGGNVGDGATVTQIYTGPSVSGGIDRSASGE